MGVGGPVGQGSLLTAVNSPEEWCSTATVETLVRVAWNISSNQPKGRIKDLTNTYNTKVEIFLLLNFLNFKFDEESKTWKRPISNSS